VLFRPKFGVKNTSYDPNVVIDRNVKNSFRQSPFCMFSSFLRRYRAYGGPQVREGPRGPRRAQTS
jgi:hypothetical protein